MLRVLRAGRRLGIVAAVRPTGAVVAGRFFSLGRDLLDDLASQDIVDVADDVSDVLDENFRLSTKHDVILIAHTIIKINLPGVFVGTLAKELEQRGDVRGGGGW